MDDRTPWYKTAFDEHYSQLYAHRSDQQANLETAWLVQHLQLSPATLTLDLCCGNGRHACCLASQGIPVVGIDLSRALLREAASRSACSFPLVRGDMRTIPFQPETFDVVLSLFTSFGYFSLDSDHLQVLRSVFDCLKPGGLFLLDFLNPPHVRKHLVPRTREVFDWGERIQHRSISSDGLRVEKTITYRPSGGSIEKRFESVRLLDDETLTNMLSQAGLHTVNVFGALDGSPYHNDAPRSVFLCRRNAS